MLSSGSAKRPLFTSGQIQNKTTQKCSIILCDMLIDFEWDIHLRSQLTGLGLLHWHSTTCNVHTWFNLITQSTSGFKKGSTSFQCSQYQYDTAYEESPAKGPKYILNWEWKCAICTVHYGAHHKALCRLHTFTLNSKCI